MFDLFVRQGAIPPPPPQLAGRPLKWNFVSRIAQALKLAETAPYEKVVQFVTQIAQIQPNIMDVINADVMAKHYISASGLNLKGITNDAKAVEQVRQNRAQQQAAQAKAEAMPKIGKGAADMAKAHQALGDDEGAEGE